MEAKQTEFFWSTAVVTPNVIQPLSQSRRIADAKKLAQPLPVWLRWTLAVLAGLALAEVIAVTGPSTAAVPDAQLSRWVAGS